MVAKSKEKKTEPGASRSKDIEVSGEAGQGKLSPDARDALKEMQSTGDAVQDLENQAAHRTKTGKISKAARDAQNQLDMIQILTPSLGALNELAASRWPEFRHTEDELKAITLASSRVLSKYLDDGMMKYQDEIILATILGGSLVDKGFKYYARVKTQKKEKPPKIQQGRTEHNPSTN